MSFLRYLTVLAVALAPSSTTWAAEEEPCPQDPDAIDVDDPCDPESSWRERPLEDAPLATSSDGGGPGGGVPSPDAEMPRDGEARGWAQEPYDELPEDAALFTPRVILAVPRVVSSAVFAPLRGLLYAVGRYRIIEHAQDLFYNDERTAAILPSLAFFGGQGLTLGASAFHQGLGNHDERIALSARFGGRFTQAYDLELTAPRVGGSQILVESLTRFEVNPRLRFYGYGVGEERNAGGVVGVGPRAATVETAFQQQRALGVLRVGYRFLDSIELSVIGIANRRDFSDESNSSKPTIGSVYDTSQVVGFDDGYTLVQPLLDVRVDTREPAGVPAQGVFVRGFGGGAPPQQGYQFVHYGFETTGYIDLYNGNRVLALRLVHESVLGHQAEIPFNELPRLGGPRRLRGYNLDRFRDKHSAVATVEYRWPVHEFVQAVGFFDAGSVGVDYPSLFEPRGLRFGGGGGFILGDRETSLFALEVAYGDGVQLLLTSDPLVAFEDRSEQL